VYGGVHCRFEIELNSCRALPTQNYSRQGYASTGIKGGLICNVCRGGVCGGTSGVRVSGVYKWAIALGRLYWVELGRWVLGKVGWCGKSGLCCLGV